MLSTRSAPFVAVTGDANGFTRDLIPPERSKQFARQPARRRRGDEAIESKDT
jgi:hypothetical protein